MAVSKRGKSYWCDFTHKGERYQRPLGTTKKREAQALEAELKKDVKNEKPKNRITYGEALLKWANSDMPQSMISHARNTRPYLDNIILSEVPREAAKMSDDMRGHGLSPQTINRRLAVVRRVLNLAFRRWDLIDQPLGQKIQLLSEKNASRLLSLSQKEVARLAESSPNDVAAKVILLAAYTGLRKSELFRLTKNDWQPPLLLVRKSKGGRPRSVPVIDELHDILALPFDITEHELRKSFEYAREQIGRPEIRFHDLRHTFASWIASSGTVPMTALRDLMGHSSLIVTSKYAHLQKDSVEMINKALKL
jgi:integrase